MNERFRPVPKEDIKADIELQTGKKHRWVDIGAKQAYVDPFEDQEEMVTEFPPTAKIVFESKGWRESEA